MQMCLPVRNSHFSTISYVNIHNFGSCGCGPALDQLWLWLNVDKTTLFHAVKVCRINIKRCTVVLVFTVEGQLTLGPHHCQITCLAIIRAVHPP